MARTVKKPAKKATVKTNENDRDLDALYSALHKTDSYKDMVKAGKVPKYKNGTIIG